MKGKALGRKALSDIATIVTPDTILRWHRQLVAAKWDYHEKRQPGRARVSEEIARLVLKMAKENPTWGYDRIQGALANLGHQISDSTVGNLLKAMALNRHPTASARPPGKLFSKPTGKY